MKWLWTVVSIIAVANILALGGVFAWLKATQRLSNERVQLVRETFARTVPAEMQEKATKSAEAEADKAKQVEAARLAIPPETAAEQIERNRINEEQKMQTLQRKQQELDSLRAMLMAELSKVEAKEKQLATDRAAFNAERARIAETEGAKQFKEALATLEGQKPKDAKQVLKALIDGKQQPQAVSYMARMDESKRSKVMAEFVKDDAALAAELLEQLRTRGTIVPATRAANADERQPTQTPATNAAATATSAPGSAGTAGAPSQGGVTR